MFWKLPFLFPGSMNSVTLLKFIWLVVQKFYHKSSTYLCIIYTLVGSYGTGYPLLCSIGFEDSFPVGVLTNFHVSLLWRDSVTQPFPFLARWLAFSWCLSMSRVLLPPPLNNIGKPLGWSAFPGSLWPSDLWHLVFPYLPFLWRMHFWLTV